MGMTVEKWAIFSDHELMILLWDAEETQNGKWIKAIRNEISRRNAE